MSKRSRPLSRCDKIPCLASVLGIICNKDAAHFWSAVPPGCFKNWDKDSLVVSWPHNRKREISFICDNLPRCSRLAVFRYNLRCRGAIWMCPPSQSEIGASPEWREIECLSGQVARRRGTESFALVARSQLAADKALSCVSSRYLMPRWAFSAQSGRVLEVTEWILVNYSQLISGRRVLKGR